LNYFTCAGNNEKKAEVDDMAESLQEKLKLRDRYYPTPYLYFTKDPGPAGAIGTNFEKFVPWPPQVVYREKGNKARGWKSMRPRDCNSATVVEEAGEDRYYPLSDPSDSDYEVDIVPDEKSNNNSVHVFLRNRKKE